VGSALAAGDAAGSGVAPGVAPGVGAGATDGSAVGVGAGGVLALGAADGSAAIVPIGAAIEKISSAICNPMRTRRTRRNDRDAAEDPNIDVTPLPRLADPTSNQVRAR
ncbi:MAG: hypothetical protein ABIZ72_03195, partial [Candidatus Limnocylindrales bacterium]